MKKVLFPFPSPAGKQILEKDHFAMQTRLNLRMQLFGKITEELFIFYFSLLSMNQYSKRILQRCVVFMAYQPRPQGAFPWLWPRPQSQGKAPWGRG